MGPPHILRALHVQKILRPRRISIRYLPGADVPSWRLHYRGGIWSVLVLLGVLVCVLLTKRIGFQAVLFINCANLLYSRYSKSQRSASYPLFKKDGKALFLLFYVTLLFAIETVYAVIQAQTIQSMYIDNRNYPGGPWAYFLATRNVLINEIFYGSLFVLTFLVDLLLVSLSYESLGCLLTSGESSSGAVGSFGRPPEGVLYRASSLRSPRS